MSWVMLELAAPMLLVSLVGALCCLWLLEGGDQDDFDAETERWLSEGESSDLPPDIKKNRRQKEIDDGKKN